MDCQTLFHDGRRGCALQLAGKEGIGMTQNRTTIKDIARECGVSLSTVSLVLNNNPRISDRTRQRVQEAVRRHAYQPNQQARGLASKSSRVVSVVVPNLNHVFSDVYFGEILSGLHARAAEADYKLLLDVANDTFLNNQEYINIIRSRRADGMLFIASSVDDTYLREMESDELPFLLVNHYYPHSKLSYVTIDYRTSARMAVDHLMELGHRKIGLIAGLNTYTGLDFRDYFIAHARQRGLRESDLPWEDGGPRWSQEGGYEAAERLLQREPRLTAIMADNDRLAMGALRFLNGRNIDVPGKISVMGVDDMPSAAYTTPPLTTIRHDLFEVGRRAMDRLLARLKGEIESCQELLPAELIVRESTGPAPNAEA
jgi:DNA-binding LacI/PurR family transcriptional regulator